MIEFGHIAYILLIPIFFSIWYIFFREKIGYIAPNILIKKYLRVPYEYRWLWCIRFIIIASFIISLSDPYILTERVEQITPKGEILIILDISRSMLAEDISPNRLEGAKSVIHTFLTQANNQEIGFMIFAGRPFLNLPFTNDIKGIQYFLERISTTYIHQEKKELSGTAIGDALLYGSTLFHQGGEGKKSILLITDGRANIGIDPYKTLPEIQKNNIILYTVGIGGEVGGELSYMKDGMKNYFYDISGNILKNDIDESLLNTLAKETGGSYIRTQNTSELIQYFKQIEQKILPPPIEKIKKTIIKLDIVFILFGIFMMLAERYFRRHIWKKYGFISK